MATYNAPLELIADERCDTTEGPLWHEDLGALFWLDIPAGRLYRFDAAVGSYAPVYQGEGQIGGFTVQADGDLLFFGERGRIWTWNPETGAEREIIAEIPAERGTRFNDVIADPEGRVFAGTMPDGERSGHLYRLDPDGALTLLLEEAGVSNGMDFTPDLTAMYHTNSTARTISRYRYDRATGEIAFEAVVVQVPEGEGVPDGMALDESGDIWSGRWDGGALFHYSPDGELLGRVPFPARKVSSLTFGGPDYADAYVTLAGGTNRVEDGEGAGSLYRAALGVRGREPFRSRIRLV
ncbi:MAG: SMP-30/gluconolactonase/LRE family protein [Thermomicrobiales bacterium]